MLRVILAALLAAGVRVFGAESFIYEVVIPISSNEVRIQTGFQCSRFKGVVTALHGVAAAKKAMARNKERTLSGLNLSEVDIDRDLAILTSEELCALPAVGLPFSEQQAVPEMGIRIAGHPLGVEALLQKRGFIGSPAMMELKSLLPHSLRKSFESRKSPSLNVDVINLDAGLDPGHSGAPVLDESGHILGVVNGGLNGNSGIAWAVRFADVKWTNISEVSREVERISLQSFKSLFRSELREEGDDDIRELGRALAGSWEPIDYIFNENITSRKGSLVFTYLGDTTNVTGSFTITGNRIYYDQFERKLAWGEVQEVNLRQMQLEGRFYEETLRGRDPNPDVQERAVASFKYHDRSRTLSISFPDGKVEFRKFIPRATAVKRTKP